MRTLHLTHRALFCTLALVACSSSPTETPVTTTDDDTDNDSDNSVTEGISLTNSGGTVESSGTTDDPSTTDDPTTDDPSTTTDPDSSGTDPTDASSSGDDSSGSFDSGESSSTGSACADSGDTIYDVQNGMIASDQPVTINCVVVTAVASNGVMAQEPDGGEYSGVFVFSVDGPDLSGAQIGDIINISGVTGEYMDSTEVDITAGTYELIDSGAPLEPEVVDITVLGDDLTAEPWESVLIRVEGDLTVTTIAASNEFVVTDGADELRIDDFFYELPTAGDFANFDVGASFTAISGPLNYFNNQFKIAGRDAADFEGYAEP
jgi:hypothetical protein